MNLRDKLRGLRIRIDARLVRLDTRRGNAPRLGAVAAACSQLFEETGDIAALRKAVALARAAVAADASSDGDGNHPEYLVTLGLALRMQYENSGDLDDLAEAITSIRAAIATIGSDSPDRAGQLINLASLLLALHEVTVGDELLDEAIAAGREGVATLRDGHAFRATALSNLGSGLTMRYERGGKAEDINDALSFHRAAVALTPVGDPDRPKWLNNLGMTLTVLTANGIGEASYREEAVCVMRESVAALPDGDPARPMALTNLVNALRGMVEHTGDIRLLREASDAARGALNITPANSPQRGIPLNNLGLVLRYLYLHTGDTAPLRESVTACRNAIATVSAGHPSRPGYLTNLGAGLWLSYECTGQREEVFEAVAVYREAGAALPDGHPGRVLQLSGLAQALKAQADTETGGGVLDEAIAVARQALAVAPANHPQYSRTLAVLSACLNLRSLRDQDPAPLYEAVIATREAIDRTPADFPRRSSVLHEHANTLHMLYDRTPHARLLLEEIVANSRSVAADDSATIGMRIAAHRRIAALAGRSDQGEAGTREALAAAEAAVALLPQIGLGVLDLSDRGRLLGSASHLAGVAAAAALDAGLLCRAVELLEQSRGVLTAESAMAESADLDRLRSAAPDLAAALEDLRARREALDRPAPATIDTPSTPGARAAARRDAQAEWDQLVTRIRSLDGFSGFLTPPGATDLTAQAAEGPVVYVCVAPKRCDALVLTGNPADPVHVVPLDALSEAEAVRRAQTLWSAVGAAGDPAITPVARRAAQRDILGVLAWLWDTVSEPVLTVLGRTSPPEPGEPWPRVWWCPVGILNYLPLQAAGHHEDLDDGSSHGAAPRTVLDRVVSSYTTTVRGLARARAHRHLPAQAARMAIISVPDAPGTDPLPGAAAEAALLTELVPGAAALPRPTRTSVLAALPDYPVAHFACHSEPHPADPWRSRLILQDHRTDPLTVADLNALRLDGGLAFLSACATSLTTPHLADEGLHITGAFQLAGYPHVVGTQWSIADRPAHQLTADFYGRLTHDGTTPPDPARSAEALHQASRRLRARYPRTPTLWAAHTHTGA